MKEYDFYGVCQNCYKLDDKIWEAKEDELDGYRSYLESIELKEDTNNLTFFQQPIAKVTIHPYDDGNKKGWTLNDVQDPNHVWLFVGTDYYDDYYPCFMFEYNPKNPENYNQDGSKKSDWEIFVSEG